MQNCLSKNWNLGNFKWCFKILAHHYISKHVKRNFTEEVPFIRSTTSRNTVDYITVEM